MNFSALWKKAWVNFSLIPKDCWSTGIWHQQMTVGFKTVGQPWRLSIKKSMCNGMFTNILPPPRHCVTLSSPRLVSLSTKGRILTNTKISRKLLQLSPSNEQIVRVTVDFCFQKIFYHIRVNNWDIIVPFYVKARTWVKW